MLLKVAQRRAIHSGDTYPTAIPVIIAANIFSSRAEGSRFFMHKYTQTRSHTDGFRRNNANYWNKREICRFYLYSSIIWFCPVLEELGK